MADVERQFDRIRRGVWVGPHAAKPYVEWNDLSRVLTELLKWTKSTAESREKFDEVMYNSLKLLLETANKDVQDKVSSITTLTQREVDIVSVTIIATANLVRLLRNSVVKLPRNQFLQVKTGLLDTILDCICFYHEVGVKCNRVKHKFPYALTYTPLCVEVIRASLQLTCNLCVGNQAVQGAVWKRLFPNMFTILIEGIDKQSRNYVCSVLFNCTAWNGSQALQQLISTDEGQAIIRSGVGLCEQPNNLEWAQLFVEGLICAERFMQVYEVCQGSPLLLTLLEILEEKIKSSPSPTKKELFGEIESAVPVTTFLFLAKTLARDRQHIIDLATGKEVGEEGAVTVRILHILAEVTGLFEHFERIIGNTPFLECAVKMLNEINTVEPIKFDRSQYEAGPEGGRYAIRKELIRIITNMCYKKKHHQDKVRLLGGVQTVLCHCILDGNNPYLLEWSIFALRMLLENNPENQDIVRSLQAVGKVSEKDAQKIGVS